MSASFAYNSPVRVVQMMALSWRALTALTVITFGVAATLIVNDSMSVRRAVLIGIAGFASAWAASIFGELGNHDKRKLGVEVISGVTITLIALICVVASATDDPRSRIVMGVVAVGMALLLWVHTALVAYRGAAFEASIGSLALMTAAVALVLISLGLDYDIRSDGAGLLIAATPPLASAALIARFSWRVLVIAGLLGLIAGALIREPTDVTIWVAVSSVAVLVYIADARLPARDHRSRISISTVDLVLASSVGIFLAVYLSFRMDEPIRGFLLGSLAIMVTAVSLLQRTIIVEREQRMLELASLTATIRERARLDPLTELPNRSALDARLLEEVERAIRYRQPLSVLFIDIDHFKEINDTRGHEVGDYVLRSLAVAIRSTIRTPDFVGRYGGEEFVVIAPATWTADAATLGHRIQAAIAQQAPHPLGRPVTISVGIAGVPEHGRDPGTVLRVADLAMYAAKFAGRNRVAIGIDSPLAPS